MHKDSSKLNVKENRRGINK